MFQGEAIYEDVPNVDGASALPEGKDTSKPPSEYGETSVSSESDSEASSVSSEEGKEIKEMTHLFQEWWKGGEKIYTFCSSLCFSFPHCG